MTQPPNLHGVKPKLGTSWKGKWLGLWLEKRDSEGEPTEWRLVASRRVLRLATERNRWKRRMREVLRECKGSIRPGYLVRLKILQGTPKMAYSELKREIIGLVKESGLWRS